MREANYLVAIRLLQHLFVACTVVTLPSHTLAEVLHEVAALETLRDIKVHYPNATFSTVKAAWVKSDEVFIRMTGNGFPGELMLAFTDSRPFWNEALAGIAAVEADEPAAITAQRKNAVSRAGLQDDDALTINWVRWIPASPIPFERYKSKYGDPTECDFTKDDMTPYCSWQPRELLARMSDDRKLVYSVEARFTANEQRSGWQRRYGYIPDWLKQAEPANGVKPSKAKVK